MLRQWARQFPSSHFGLETLNVLENKVNKAQCQTQERQVLIRDSFGLDCCHLELLIGSLLLFSIRVVQLRPIRSAMLCINIESPCLHLLQKCRLDVFI